MEDEEREERIKGRKEGEAIRGRGKGDRKEGGDE